MSDTFLWEKSVEELARLLQEAHVLILDNRKKVDSCRKAAKNSDDDVLESIQLGQESASHLLQRASHFLYEVLGDFASRYSSQVDSIKEESQSISKVKESMKRFFTAQAEVLAGELEHFQHVLGAEQQRSFHRLELLYSNFCWRKHQRKQKECLTKWRQRVSLRCPSSPTSPPANRYGGTATIECCTASNSVAVQWCPVSTGPTARGSRLQRSSEVGDKPVNSGTRGNTSTKAEGEILKSGSPSMLLRRVSSNRGLYPVGVAHTHLRNRTRFSRTEFLRRKRSKRVHLPIALIPNCRMDDMRDKESDSLSFRSLSRHYSYCSRSLDLFMDFMSHKLRLFSEGLRIREVGATEAAGFPSLGGGERHPRHAVLDSQTLSHHEYWTERRCFSRWVQRWVMRLQQDQWDSRPHCVEAEDDGIISSPDRIEDTDTYYVSSPSYICSTGSDGHSASLSVAGVSEGIGLADACEKELLDRFSVYEELARRAAVIVELEEENGRLRMAAAHQEWWIAVTRRQVSLLAGKCVPALIEEQKTLAAICLSWEAHSNAQVVEQEKWRWEEQNKLAQVAHRGHIKRILARLFGKWKALTHRSRITAMHQQALQGKDELLALHVDAVAQKLHHASSFSFEVVALCSAFCGSLTRLQLETQNRTRTLVRRLVVSRNRMALKMGGAITCNTKNTLAVAFLQWRCCVLSKLNWRRECREKLYVLMSEKEKMFEKYMEQKQFFMLHLLSSHCKQQTEDIYRRRAETARCKRTLTEVQQQRTRDELDQKSRQSVLLLRLGDLEAEAGMKTEIIRQGCVYHEWMRVAVARYVEHCALMVQHHSRCLTAVFVQAVVDLPMCRWQSSRHVLQRGTRNASPHASSRSSIFSTEVDLARSHTLCYKEYAELSRKNFDSSYEFALLAAEFTQQPAGGVVPLRVVQQYLEFTSRATIEAVRVSGLKLEHWRSAAMKIYLSRRAASVANAASQFPDAAQPGNATGTAHPIAAPLSFDPLALAGDKTKAVLHRAVQQNSSCLDCTALRKEVAQFKSVQGVLMQQVDRACVSLLTQRRYIAHSALIHLRELEENERLRLESSVGNAFLCSYRVFISGLLRIQEREKETLVQEQHQLLLSASRNAAKELKDERDRQWEEFKTSEMQRCRLQTENRRLLTQAAGGTMMHLMQRGLLFVPWTEAIMMLEGEMLKRKLSWFTLSVRRYVRSVAYVDRSAFDLAMSWCSLRFDSFLSHRNCLLSAATSTLRSVCSAQYRIESSESDHLLHSDFAKRVVKEEAIGHGIGEELSGRMQTDVSEEIALYKRLIDFSAALSASEAHLHQHVDVVDSCAAQIQLIGQRSDKLLRLIRASC